MSLVKIGQFNKILLCASAILAFIFSLSLADLSDVRLVSE